MPAAAGKADPLPEETRSGKKKVVRPILAADSFLAHFPRNRTALTSGSVLPHQANSNRIPAD
jgi:hypothetical protein